MGAQVVCVSFGKRRSGKRRKKDPAYPPGQASRNAAAGAPKGREFPWSRRRLCGADCQGEALPARRLSTRRSPLPAWTSAIFDVLSAETRNLPCAANHCLIKEPFSSAAGLQLNTPKVVGTFRFRCSGLLGYDASRRISFGWNSSLPPETPLRTCAMSGLFSAVFATTDWRTDIV
jgi:hypothetical protein